jgi:hypothetical protein
MFLSLIGFFDQLHAFYHGALSHARTLRSSKARDQSDQGDGLRYFGAGLPILGP